MFLFTVFNIKSKHTSNVCINRTSRKIYPYFKYMTFYSILVYRSLLFFKPFFISTTSYTRQNNVNSKAYLLLGVESLQIFKLKDLYVQREWYSILYRQLNNSCTLNTHTNMKSCSILKATYFSAQFFCIKMVNTSTLYYCINSTQKLKLPEKLRYTL